VHSNKYEDPMVERVVPEEIPSDSVDTDPSSSPSVDQKQESVNESLIETESQTLINE